MSEPIRIVPVRRPSKVVPTKLRPTCEGGPVHTDYQLRAESGCDFVLPHA